MTFCVLSMAPSDFQDFSNSALLALYLLQRVKEEIYVMCSLSWALLMQSKSLLVLSQGKGYGYACSESGTVLQKLLCFQGNYFQTELE